MRDGRLAGVIDFGAAGVGDPACDLMVAWNVLPVAARQSFQDAVGLDEATWLRGRGWALWKALITLRGQLEDGPGTIPESRRVIDAVLADPG